MIRTPLKYLLRGAEGESDKNGLLEAECVKHTQKSANDKCISLVMSNRAESESEIEFISFNQKCSYTFYFILPWLCAANLLVPLRFHLARLFFVHFTTTIGDELHLRSEK